LVGNFRLRKGLLCIIDYDSLEIGLGFHIINPVSSIVPGTYDCSILAELLNNLGHVSTNKWMDGYGTSVYYSVYGVSLLHECYFALLLTTQSGKFMQYI
jgi:hypothetical protein